MQGDTDIYLRPLVRQVADTGEGGVEGTWGDGLQATIMIMIMADVLLKLGEFRDWSWSLIAFAICLCKTRPC